MMTTERQNQLLGALRNRYAMFGKNEQPMNVSVYADYYWEEITELAELSPEYVRYTPPNPKGNPMYETGKHEILPAIMNLPENIGKTVAPATEAAPQVAAPTSDTVGIPMTDSTQYHVTEKFNLFYVIAPDKRVLTTGYTDRKILAIICELLNKETSRIAELERENEELERENENRRSHTAQIDAQLDKQARMNLNLAEENAQLKAENARMKDLFSYLRKKVHNHYAEAKSKATKASMGGDADKERYYAGIEDELGIILGAFSNIAEQFTSEPASETRKLSLPLPKYAIGQAVWVVFNYGRGFGLANKAATIVEIKQEDGTNWYRVRYEISDEDGTQFFEEYEICPREKTS